MAKERKDLDGNVYKTIVHAGKDIEEMNREEMIECIHELFLDGAKLKREIKRLEREKLDWMGVAKSLSSGRSVTNNEDEKKDCGCVVRNNGNVQLCPKCSKMFFGGC